MDSANDNDQPISSSSASSSNNSSSSNLLVNLPMLPPHSSRVHNNDDDDNGDDDDEDFNAIHMPMQQSPITPGRVNTPQFNQESHASDDSVFISPLLFNNNVTLPTSSSASSSTSSSSSSSHNLLQNQQCISPPTPFYSNTEHLTHQQHSFPTSSFHQQHAPSPNQQPQFSSTSSHSHEQTLQQSAAPEQQLEQHHQQLQEATLEHSSEEDNNDIADTIDASIIEPNTGLNVESNFNEVDLRADVATTSQQTRQFGGDSNIGVDSATTASEQQEQLPQTPPTSLPLLLQAESKHQPSSSSSPYFSHSFTAQPYHYQANTNLSGTTCSNIFNFHNKNNANGISMFGHNDTTGLGGQQHPSSSSHNNQHSVDRLKLLYPNVNENETPLPRSWSAHDKCLSIGLSQNNLRVHYKGVGKQHAEPASVRTAHPIPPTCGLYYFEVKIISKGKNGYMGMGLTAQHFRMNRLPGWDKHTYGYHGVDGNSFSSSANGLSYGPAFTTGDVIGCCVNFVNNTCFYTKNGIDLGIAFRDLPTKLYPTVGLQTPGEEVDANFGQEPFKFDQIEDMMKQMRAEMKQTIYNFPMSMEYGDPTTLLHKLVSSYLVHNGYSETAEAFSKTTGQIYEEEMPSIRSRQKILKLIMSGKMGQAIEQTLCSYPGLLENNKNLWFMLKCRQFIEMVNGSDLEYCPINNKITNSTTTQIITTTPTTTPPPNQTSVIQSTKTYQNGKSTSTNTNTNSSAVINTDNHQHNNHQDLKNNINLIDNCSGDNILNSKNNENHTTNIDYLNDVEMENNGHATNGNVCKNGTSNNNFSSSLDLDEEMDIDVAPATRKYSYGIERILEFGKELSQMGQQLEKDNKMNDEDRQMLEDAFSLIAYSNPWSSPLGWQLCPTKREVVCKALNSAMLESMNYPRRPPLDHCVAHAAELLKVMGQVAIGCSAFVNVSDVFPQN